MSEKQNRVATAGAQSLSVKRERWRAGRRRIYRRNLWRYPHLAIYRAWRWWHFKRIPPWRLTLGWLWSVNPAPLSPAAEAGLRRRVEELQTGAATAATPKDSDSGAR